MIQVLIHSKFEDQVRSEFVAQAVQAVLEQEFPSLCVPAERIPAERVPGAEANLSVVITDDDEMQSLNLQFRGVDAPTDVLAFGEEESELPFVTPAQEPPYLGDVIISFPRAHEQAAEMGHDIATELQLLIVHGVLHLLGYDHATPEEKDLMWARQEAILAISRNAFRRG
jgi:probable rRNA maturation factor